MTSRLVSSTQSSPRRVTIPALPRMFSRSATTTPRPYSPNPEMSAVAEHLAGMSIAGGDEVAETTKAAEEPPVATPPNGIQIAIVVDDAGSPTRQQVQLRGDAAVFEDPTTAANDTAVNPGATHTLNTSRAPITDYQTIAPRPDRVNQVPNAGNAQGIFPPDALIFVANLSTQRSEEDLENTCHETFDEYGTNHVKIRRDRNRHPYAFIQFEHVEDAENAVSGVHGMILDGRKIRIERAKAERAVILSKADGGSVTEAEARGVLERFGPLDLIAATNAPNRRFGGLAQAMFVRFAYYLDCRDALRLFDNHRSGFHLYLAPSLEPRFRFNSEGTPTVRSFAPPRSAIDQKSVYVGNLPEGTNKAELEDYFSEFGQVVNANVMRKEYDNGKIVNHFGFVEFMHAHEAMHAAAGERTFKGVKLRVEGKEYSSRHQARIVTQNHQLQQTSWRNNSFEEGRHHTENRRYNARGPRHEYYHAHPAGPGVFNPMTPPSTVQYPHHGMQGNMYGTPFQPAVNNGFGMVTPPSQSGMAMNLNQMLPTGIFSPTPSHLADAHYSYQGVPFGSGPVYTNHGQGYAQGPAYMNQQVGTIEEAEEQGYY